MYIYLNEMMNFWGWWEMGIHILLNYVHVYVCCTSINRTWMLSFVIYLNIHLHKLYVILVNNPLHIVRLDKHYCKANILLFIIRMVKQCKIISTQGFQ